MEIHEGPSRATLDAMDLRFEQLLSNECVKMTLSTNASDRTFKRKVRLTLVRPEMVGDNEREPADFLEAVEDIMGHSKPSGRLLLRGRIGRWYFTGIYDPHTRKGTLEEVEYDPQLEAQLEEEDGIATAVALDRELRGH